VRQQVSNANSFLCESADHNNGWLTCGRISHDQESECNSHRGIRLIARNDGRGENTVICSFATLDDSALEKIKALESETGETLLAYDCFRPVTLSDEKLHKIRVAERELCRTLIAVKTGHKRKVSGPPMTA